MKENALPRSPAIAITTNQGEDRAIHKLCGDWIRLRKERGDETPKEKREREREREEMCVVCVKFVFLKDDANPLLSPLSLSVSVCVDRESW